MKPSRRTLASSWWPRMQGREAAALLQPLPRPSGAEAAAVALPVHQAVLPSLPADRGRQ